MTGLRIRYLGGPTAVLEIGGLRLLTDPTFDPAGDHPVGSRVLTKTFDALVDTDSLGAVDAVLLSHDQHPDNLDDGGREFLTRVPTVLSTPAAAERLGTPVVGMQAWESRALGELTVTAVPARHGPPGSEPVVGQVTGFVLTGAALPTVYVSGDNASLDHVRTIGERFAPVDVALLFAGAARTALLDGAALTLSSDQAAQAALLLRARAVLPLHFEGWKHFTEGRNTLGPAFARAGLTDRLTVPALGAWWESEGVSTYETH